MDNNYPRTGDELLKEELNPIALSNNVGELETSHLTDTSNAEKIVEMFGDKIRFDHKRRRWLVWKGHRWQPDNNEEIDRMAIQGARERYKDSANIEDLRERGAAAKWAIQSEQKQKIDAAKGVLKSLLPVADTGENWDTNPMLLSCPNGIVDLTTGELRDGKPEDRITMTTGINYNPDADYSRWKQFIIEVFESNKELIRYVYKALGYSITGSTKEQCAFFCFGTGSNGKSVLFRTIRNVLGDYAHDAPNSLFQRNIMATSTNDVADTEFKRFLVSSETLSTSKLNEQRLKAWTGGDRVTARQLYKNFSSFDPTVKPWLFINHKPAVEDDSFGFWRRVRLIPFNRKFTNGDADLELPNKLKAETEGILAWLVKGCLLWQKEGLSPTPEIVLSATKDYQVENDALAEFIFDACTEDSSLETKASDLYKAYKLWAEQQSLSGKDILLNTAFGRRMNDKYQKQRTNKGIFYKGIGISVGFANKFSLAVKGLTPNSVTLSEKNLMRESIKTTLNPTRSLKNSDKPYTDLKDIGLDENYEFPEDQI